MADLRETWPADQELARKHGEPDGSEFSDNKIVSNDRRDADEQIKVTEVVA